MTDDPREHPSGGPLAIPWGHVGLVITGVGAIGLLGTLIPATLVGRARQTNALRRPRVKPYTASHRNHLRGRGRPRTAENGRLGKSPHR